MTKVSKQIAMNLELKRMGLQEKLLDHSLKHFEAILREIIIAKMRKLLAKSMKELRAIDECRSVVQSLF